MSLERVIKALVSLGLSRMDAEIYVYTAKKGPQTISELVKAFQYSRNQIYSALKNLIILGIVMKEVNLFSALSFEEALELLIKKEKERAKSIERNMEELIVSWKKEDCNC